MEGDKSKIEKLTGKENWSSWKFQIQILLDARNALEVVTGEERDPGQPEGLAGAALTAHEKKRAEYKKANKIAKELIVTTVEKKSSSSF